MGKLLLLIIALLILCIITVPDLKTGLLIVTGTVVAIIFQLILFKFIIKKEVQND